MKKFHIASITLATFTLCALYAFAQNSANPPKWKFSSPLQVDGDWQVSKGETIATLPLADNTTTRIPVKLSGYGIQQSLIQGADGNDYKFRIVAAENNINLEGKQFKLDTLVGITLSKPGDELNDGTIYKGYYNIYPSPLDYKGDERKVLLEHWDERLQANATPLPLDITVSGGRFDMWLNDHYLGGGAVGASATLQLKLSSAAIGKVTTWPAPNKNFVEVGLDGNNRKRTSFTFDTPQLKTTTQQTIDGVPFRVSQTGSIDVGTSRWPNPLSYSGFTDPYFSRSSFDSVPQDILLAVPSDDYSSAHLLCAIDPDPAKTPELTLRLSRFNGSSVWGGGRGDGIADSFIRLEKIDGKWPDGVREMGTVTGKDKEGKTVSMPLLDVTVPIHSGEIPDVIDGDVAGLGGNRTTQYLDLELTNKLFLASPASYDSFTLKPQGLPSSINVLGLTLERAEVKVRDKKRRIGNTFYTTEKPGFDLEMDNRSNGSFTGKLSWQLTDYYGKSSTGEQKVLLDASSKSTIQLDLPKLELGWYEADLTLSDANNRIIWQQPTSLAVLAPDTRKAGLNAPFGTWWFRDGHGGTTSIPEVAPLLTRMGVPYVTPGDTEREGESSIGLAKYGLGVSMLPWPGGDLEKKKATLDDYMKHFPDAKYALIFHETGWGTSRALAPEFLGKPKPTLDEQTEKVREGELATVLPYARYIREKYPQLKLIVGNGSYNFTWSLMQTGYPKDLVDYWGDETLGQSIIPEAPSGAQWYWTEQYNKKYGYNKGLASCFEWRGRGTSPGNLSELMQAQFYTRDVLMALAFNAPRITPGMLYDVGDMYYYSRWGSGGFLRRYPLLNPKISYVAMAVLTQQLDQAKFVRTMKTDSPSLNVLEFQRGGMWTYAMWVPRGQKPVTLTFEKSAGKPALVDMNGRSTAVQVQNNQAQITVSASPLYFHTGVRLANISSGDTTFPAPAATVVEGALDASNWEVATEWDMSHDPNILGIEPDAPREMVVGTIANVADSQKGNALQVTPPPTPDIPWPVGRVMVLKAKQPVTLTGTPQNVGVWVKGNSSWGRVYFGIQDATGRTYYSYGVPSGWNLLDWKGSQYIDFDGWNYISVKLPAVYPNGHDQPQLRNWFTVANKLQMKYPVKVIKIVVELRDKTIQVDRTVDVPDPSIRLFGLGGF
jgi:hypothetical protein